MDLLLPGLGLIVWNSLFFLIAVAILTKFAWKPILLMLDARDKHIAESLEKARQAREELSGVKAESQQILRQARKERDSILEQARQEAGVQAASILDDAHTMIEREKQRAKDDLRRDLAGISVTLAEKVLGEELKDADAQRKSIEKSIEEVTL